MILESILHFRQTMEFFCCVYCLIFHDNFCNLISLTYDKVSIALDSTIVLKVLVIFERCYICAIVLWLLPGY